jgi:hypothetical protein
MLQKVAAKQSDCLEHALRCRERASAATAPSEKMSWLKMADGWELLALSYGMEGRLHDFLRSRKRAGEIFEV